MKNLAMFLAVFTSLLVSTYLSAESTKTRLEEEALNDLEFGATTLLQELTQFEDSTLTLTTENTEQIRSVANRLGMVMAKLDITYSAKEFSQMLMQSTQRSSVNSGLVVPMIRIMDRALGNGEKGIANVINPLLGELNPRIGGFLNSRLALNTRLPDRGASVSRNSRDAGENTTHTGPEISTRGYETGVGRGAEAAFAFELKVEKSFDRLFGKGISGNVVLGTGPFVEINRRHATKDEQLSIGRGCIEDIAWHVVTHGIEGATAGAAAGGKLGAPLAGGILGGIVGLAYGAKTGFQTPDCKANCNDDKKKDDKPSAPTAPGTPKQPVMGPPTPKEPPKTDAGTKPTSDDKKPEEKPQEKPAKDPKDKPDKPNDPDRRERGGHTARPADGNEGPSAPLTPAEQAKREKEKQEQEQKKHDRLINYPPDYNTYTPAEKLSFEEEQRRKLAPYTNPRNTFENNGPTVPYDEFLRRRMVPLIYITN